MNNILKVIVIIFILILVSTQVYSVAPSKATVSEEKDLGKYPDEIKEEGKIVLGDKEGNVMISWPSDSG